MTQSSSIHRYSQALIPFDPSLSPKTFVQHEMDKISKKAVEHLIETSLTTERLLSYDKLPNPCVGETIRIIRKLDLHQDQRFKIAQRSMELNPKETIACIEQFDLTQDQHFELTKIFLTVNPRTTLYQLHDFKLSKRNFFEIAVQCAVTNSATACFAKACGHLKQEHRFIIAMQCAQKMAIMAILYIEDFDLTQDQRFEVAKVCVKTEDLDDYLETFSLSQVQKREITTLQNTVTLDYDLVQKILGPTANQVVVYGFDSAKYSQIHDALEEPGSPFKQVFNHQFGDPEVPEYCTTLEGSPIEQFPVDEIPNPSRDASICKRQNARWCKAALTNLVLENFKRKQEGLPLIPLLFCIESPSTVKEHKLTVQSLTTKEDVANGLVTHSELRRMYKLCKELENDADPIGEDLAQIARETLKMVRLKRSKNHDGTYVMLPVVPVWEEPEWDTAWIKRIRQTKRTTRLHKRAEKEYYWRSQLLARVHEFLKR